ncbi:hypothetical protein Hbl1158_07750 [Halobaculum sp. CBA1158]|uniref:hypothetical protein n=1 Tax=Halobaculum sp. CBA1158 TaxID=2904243 RepID=UPI001F4899A6|nr:hypothetical protein [Halobaculum sp. CBA1158]UIO98459.1 hypothetical protein Hbl1158_07750 [Halobaculum sp. CBA1158]
MIHDIRDHPDAPSIEELREFTLVPVAREEIVDRRADGEELSEVNVREARDDVHVELEPDPTDRGSHDDIGTALYRLVQLFGTPNVPDYDAGSDLSEREDTTFKYLLRVVNESEEENRSLPDEWLVTVYDYHVELGVGLAGWSDGTDPAEYDGGVQIVSLALVTNVVGEPLQCVYKDKWY